MKITYHAAASRDGFIAREDGDVSWLDEVDTGIDETAYAEFFDSVDGLVMGRKTYDFVFDYGSWPYGDKPTWVCTSHELAKLGGANLTVVSTIEAVMEDALSRNIQHLWLVGGGQLASAFLEKDLLTQISITEMPITLKKGIPLFARHSLEEIHPEMHQTFVREEFRQIEIALPK